MSEQRGSDHPYAELSEYAKTLRDKTKAYEKKYRDLLEKWAIGTSSQVHPKHAISANKLKNLNENIRQAKEKLDIAKTNEDAYVATKHIFPSDLPDYLMMPFSIAQSELDEYEKSIGLK